MIEKSKLDAIVQALCNPPSHLEQFDALKAENARLFKELKCQYITNYLLEDQLKPKKRGRKPSPKLQINSVPGKLGRPLEFTDKTHEVMIELVDTLKEQEGFKTDKDALMYFLEVICVDSGRYKSKHKARKDFRSLQVQLSKARNKNKQPTD